LRNPKGLESSVSDAAGQAVGRVQYDPYGEVLTSTLPITLTDRLFTGARFDGTIGLYQMGARWYDPALGRRIQADSIVPEPGNLHALNRYSYVYNNPLRFVDPTGLFTEEELINWGVYTAEELKGLAENQAEWYGILMQAELGDFVYFGDSDMLGSHAPMGFGQFTLYNEKLILAGRLTVWNAQSGSYNLLWDEHSVRAWEKYFTEAAATTENFGTFRPDTPVEDYTDVGACTGAVVGVCAGRVTLDTGERYHYSTVIGVYTPQSGGAALRGIAINADDFAGMSLQVSVSASVNIPLLSFLSGGVGFFGWPGGAWGMELGPGVGVGGVPIGPVSVSGSVQLLESTRLPQ
jgi:RHS repeat-associated protein